jgi:peptidoglycan/LPS O-acetylase OafA/YrhL
MTSPPRPEPRRAACGPDIVPVSPNPYRFRTGRVVLVLEGVLLLVLGAWGLAAAGEGTAPPAGATVGPLQLTTAHAALLLGTGVLAVGCSVRRRPALAVVTAQAVGYAVLFLVGLVGAAHEVPTVLGFDYGDAVLHGGLMVIGLGLGMWMAGEGLEGLWWERRRRASRPDDHHRSGTSRPPS